MILIVRCLEFLCLNAPRLLRIGQLPGQFVEEIETACGTKFLPSLKVSISDHPRKEQDSICFEKLRSEYVRRNITSWAMYRRSGEEATEPGQSQIISSYVGE